jgi:hypothetical protein
MIISDVLSSTPGGVRKRTTKELDKKASQKAKGKCQKAKRKYDRGSLLP